METLAADVIRELVTRNGLEASLIDDVVLGTSTPTGPNGLAWPGYRARSSRPVPLCCHRDSA